jgi:DNA-binding MurR/RpiR family transcriptional regulator
VTIGVAGQARQQDESTTFERWIIGLSESGSLTAKGKEVLSVLRTQPRMCAFGITKDIAARAGVDIATITRAAQALGYPGWPAFQRDFRSRYVSSLSVSEMASEHGLSEPTGAASLAKDREDLDFITKSVSLENLKCAAELIQGARRTVILAQGSYAAVGLALAHNAQLAGYDVRHVSDPAALANLAARMGEDDLLIAINMWKIYEVTVQILESLKEKSTHSVVITDAPNPVFDSLAELQIKVPSESASFFPSLTGALAIAQAIVVELTQLDPEKTQRAIQDAESEWRRLSLLH